MSENWKAVCFLCSTKSFVFGGLVKIHDHSRTRGRVSNLKYASVGTDFKTKVFIRSNPGKKETTDGSGLHVNFIEKQCSFPKVVSPEKWYVTNIKPRA